MSDVTVNPKTAMWINIALSVCVALAGAGAMFIDLFGELASKRLVAGFGLGAMVLGAVNAALHALSTGQRGPLTRYLESGPGNGGDKCR